MRARPASPTPRTDRLIHGLAIGIIALLMLLSPMALNGIGWNYDGLGGAGPTRFHPSMYLTLITFIVIALRDGNPLASVLSTFAQDARVTLFLLIWILVFWHGVANQGLPAAGLIDTYLMPMLLLLIFRRLEDETKARMVMVIHGVFAANALLGIGEVVTGLRLTPYVAGGILITDDWRATALLGHPLGNALMTGCYVMFLMMGGGQEVQGRWRNATLAMQCAAMVAFGGRASLVLLLLFLLATLGLKVVRFLAGARVDLRFLTLLAVLLPVGISVLGLAFELGVFDRLILRFVDDNDSANARVKMFELFHGFTLEEILFGPQQDHLGYLVRVYRLEFGIESVWVAFTLYYGFLPMVLFFTGFFLFMTSVMTHCQRRGWVVVGYFFLVNTTFLGIAGKSLGVSILCLMLLLLVPRYGSYAERLPRQAPSFPREARPAC
ncbi:MAG: VpsF family polysaccharide biosynthesis protein [Beijerinckiaceae bacterium]|nr:VpsF family polysaccharide biosynthesis protein [Beijerinckiaceae bacterium]